MREVLEYILNDENHPATDGGKRVHLMMKFGPSFLGLLYHGLTEGSYRVRTQLAEAQSRRTEMFDVYINGEDVAAVMAPVTEQRIIPAGLDISKLKIG